MVQRLVWKLQQQFTDKPNWSNKWLLPCVSWRQLLQRSIELSSVLSQPLYARRSQPQLRHRRLPPGPSSIAFPAVRFELKGSGVSTKCPKSGQRDEARKRTRRRNSRKRQTATGGLP